MHAFGVVNMQLFCSSIAITTAVTTVVVVVCTTHLLLLLLPLFFLLMRFGSESNGVCSDDAMLSVVVSLAIHPSIHPSFHPSITQSINQSIYKRIPIMSNSATKRPQRIYPVHDIYMYV